MRHNLSVAQCDTAASIDRWFRRFNLPLDAGLPDLADARTMDGLAEAAWEHFASDPAVDDLARAVLASSFYFKLRSLPIFENGRYLCYGRILCRIPVTKPAFDSLMRKLRSMSAQFVIQNKKDQGKRAKTFVFDNMGNFSKPVTFYVDSLDKPVHVLLKLLQDHGYHISASPFAIKHLVDLQKL